MPTVAKNKQLLAVDVGPRNGLAMFGPDGRLLWYRSQPAASPLQLRRAAGRAMGAAGDVDWLISEGDVALAAIWERVAMRQGVRVQRVDRLTWRAHLLPEAGAAGAEDAEAVGSQRAQELARQVISWSGGTVPVVLHPSAAAAILIGLWGVMQLGWLATTPWQRGVDAMRSASLLSP